MPIIKMFQGGYITLALAALMFVNLQSNQVAATYSINCDAHFWPSDGKRDSSVCKQQQVTTTSEIVFYCSH
jgi:hypothetical protein